jgi:hypothetical protein
MNSCSNDDKSIMSRDIGDFEDFDSFAKPCIINDNDATYRGLAFEVEWFDGCQGFDMPVHALSSFVKPTAVAPVEPTPVLTDAAGFVASQKLFL